MNTLYGFWSLFKREFLRFFTVMNTTIFPQLLTVFFYFLIFGIILGTRINEVSGYPYLLFILPGLYVQNLINGSYSNASGSLYISRTWTNMKDILLTPLTYAQLTLSYIFASMMRGFFLAIGTLILARVFLPIQIHHMLIFILYSLLISFAFACLGVIIGLWANDHQQLNIFINFVVTPLTFLGGVFYSLDMVTPLVKTITLANPLFYMIAGIRYGMLDIAETNYLTGLIILLLVNIILYTFVYKLFKKGYNLRV